jgi:hypothetical protein
MLSKGAFQGCCRVTAGVRQKRTCPLGCTAGLTAYTRLVPVNNKLELSLLLPELWVIPPMLASSYLEPSVQLSKKLASHHDIAAVEVAVTDMWRVFIVSRLGCLLQHSASLCLPQHNQV